MTKVEKEIIDTIIIPIEEYKELLIYKGRYEELAQVCYNKMTSPLIRPDVTGHPLTRSNIHYSKGINEESVSENTEA